MTKLSLVLDQEIRCWIPGSSNILLWWLAKTRGLNMEAVAFGIGVGVLI